jgi:hypothetical protein
MLARVSINGLPHAVMLITLVKSASVSSVNHPEFIKRRKNLLARIRSSKGRVEENRLVGYDCIESE